LRSSTAKTLFGRRASVIPIGGNSEVRVSPENGYLYLNGRLKLIEMKPGFFITADGDAVIFEDDELSVGNKLYSQRK
jgi:hypothetical protein